MAGPLAEGDEVRYTAAFLRSTGQHIAPEGSRVHRSGRVVRVEDPWLVVDWGDRYQGPWDDLPPGQSRVHPSAVGRAWEARTYDLPVALAWPT